jgi:hypothetical protein
VACQIKAHTDPQQYLFYQTFSFINHSSYYLKIRKKLTKKLGLSAFKTNAPFELPLRQMLIYF